MIVTHVDGSTIYILNKVQMNLMLQAADMLSRIQAGPFCFILCQSTSVTISLYRTCVMLTVRTQDDLHFPSWNSWRSKRLFSHEGAFQPGCRLSIRWAYFITILSRELTTISPEQSFKCVICNRKSARGSTRRRRLRRSQYSMGKMLAEKQNTHCESLIFNASLF